MEGLSPREIIAQLHIEEIDRAIEDLNEELNALKALRKVAAAKNSKAPASESRGNGRSSAARSGSNPTAAERLETAIQALEKWGPQPVSKLAERVGYSSKGVRWLLKAIESDSRFSVDRDGTHTTISLA